MVRRNDRLEDREVLVVEDDPEINRLVGAYVELAGFRYVAAFDGRQALKHAREQKPWAIVLDLMLPDVSGWEVFHGIKADADTHEIPVIILTALDNEDSRIEGMRCGVADYITKPFDPEKLLEALNRHAGRHAPQQARASTGE